MCHGLHGIPVFFHGLETCPLLKYDLTSWICHRCLMKLFKGALENAGVAKMQGWKTRDWKMQECEKYGKQRFQKCVSGCTD